MSENKLIDERKRKIKSWEDLGFPSFVRSFDRTHTSKEASFWVDENKKSIRSTQEVMQSPESKIRMCGRIVQFRDMGKLVFLSLRDKDGDFQLCFAQGLLGDTYDDLIRILDLGDYMGAEGEFFLTKHGEPTLMVSKVTPLSKSIRSFPEKWAGIKDKEQCYRQRNLDLMANKETQKRFHVRSKIIRSIRNFYEKLGFIEVETSVLQSQAGGAMAETFMTHHKSLDHDFHLRIALELPLKILCSGGFERVFEIGKCFRNEGTDPSHLQEFTMLEWYAAFVDIETNKKWNEQMLCQICEEVFGTSKIEILDKDGKKHLIDFSKKFESHSFAHLLKEYADIDMFAISDEDLKTKAKKFGVEKVEGVGRAHLLDDVYKKTARPHLIQPTFVTDYPEDLKPLARPNGDGTASCFQILVGGWEIINAYGELCDPFVQRALLEKQAKLKLDGDKEAMEVDEVFLRAMEHGFPPMTGQGMGIDRIVSLFTGQSNLRDVVFFPTMKVENISK